MTDPRPKKTPAAPLPFPPRVRIAPSPTGALHIGTARTALFNWLFAKQTKGVFILRIEDTDLERSDPAFETDIVENLRWLGIVWDEGPDIGGTFGLYRQSERRERYAEYLHRLLEQGSAYHCFCSEAELEDEREAMMMRGEAPRYSGKCRALAPAEVDARLAKGIPSIIRLKMPARKVVIQDLIRGAVSFDTSLIGDIAIAKNPETPLYNFAVVADDAEMKISHVLRGEDHLSNTPKQWMIAEALDLPHPAYGHFPLILGPDRSKLSKRHGVPSIAHYRQEGYLPEALVNFIALLGWHPEGDEEILSRDDLISQFSIERIQKAGAVFNIAKLDWMNAEYIRRIPDAELKALLLPYLTATGAREGEYLDKVISLEKARIKKLSDIVEATDYFFRRPAPDPALLAWKGATAGETKENIEKIMTALAAVEPVEFDRASIERALAPLCGGDRGKVLWPFRAALTGKATSPGPFEIAEILGKDETLSRLHYAATILSR